MIIKTTAFQVGDKHYGTLEEAQKESIKSLINDNEEQGKFTVPSAWFALRVIENRDKIIDILTTTEKSRPKARKVNGAVRTRKSKRHNAEQFTLPITTTEAKA